MDATADIARLFVDDSLRSVSVVDHEGLVGAVRHRDLEARGSAPVDRDHTDAPTAGT